MKLETAMSGAATLTPLPEWRAVRGGEADAA